MREFYAGLPLDERLKRLARTPDDLATAVHGRRAAISHDDRLAMDDPKVLVVGARPPDPAEWGLVGDELPVDPDRWAEERQYARSDPAAALTAFRKRRGESLDFFDRLAPEQWKRGCLHPALGRVTFTEWTALVPGHDDNHLDQLVRALAGRA